jgi:hypothetical protein
LILTHFTAAIFVASQERVAPRCEHRKRRATPLATKSARPLRVEHIGPPGAFRRLPAISESGVPHRAARRAPRLPGGPMCAHEMGQYQGRLV